MKTDYYELLQVTITASNVELKKAYRKKALQLHPDKNPDDIENATRLFNDVRIAYETLIDPQERSWYDSHKYQILMEDGDFDEGNDDDNSSQFYFAGVTVEDIQKYFNSNLYQKYDNSMHGFYAVVNVLLDKIASEEVSAGKQQKLPGFDKFKDDTSYATACDAKELMYPRFGNSNSDFGDQVRIFYKIWQNFQSVKTFTWLDEYRYVNAPDRRTRRLMEKENKKLRDQARRNYNEVVRKFIGFIKKLDPRMDPVARKKYEQEKIVKQRQEMKKQAQLEKEERKRQRQQYCEQDWQTTDPDELEQIEEQLNKIYEEEKKLNGTVSDEEDDINIYECIVCNKTFKSEKQFEDHEKSKKHLKLLKQLKWEMKKEGIELGIDQENYIDEPLNGEEVEGDMGDDFDLDEFDDALETLDELDCLDDENIQNLLEKNLISDLSDLSEADLVEINDEIDDHIDEDDIFFAKQNSCRMSIPLPETIRTTKESKQLEELSNLMGKSSLDSDSDENWATNKNKNKNKNKTKKKKAKKTSV